MPCATWLARSLGWRAQFEGGMPCASRGQNQAPRGALENRSQPAERGRQEVHCRQRGCGKQGDWFPKPQSATYCCGPEARHLPSLSLSGPTWEMGIVILALTTSHVKFTNLKHYADVVLNWR